MLEQHVLGVLVHDVPNRHYFYTINSTVSGSANLNIEGIRRTLLDMYSQLPLPRTIYVQGDNASDNKCWALLLFFAMLIFHDYTADIYFSFLIVGHTHEDIDQVSMPRPAPLPRPPSPTLSHPLLDPPQVFSTLSRYIKNIVNILDPKQFEQELRNAMVMRHSKFEHIRSVFDCTHCWGSNPTAARTTHACTLACS